MSAGLCLEVLIATVVAWVGVWGIVDEAVGIVESRAVRCCLYAALPSTRRCPLRLRHLTSSNTRVPLTVEPGLKSS
jgi:hypothetical protein